VYLNWSDFHRMSHMALLESDNNQSHSRIVIVKGAPELILPKCKCFYNEDGALTPVSAHLTALKQEIDSMSLTGQRYSLFLFPKLSHSY
jgi:magnesium-transporting ATPase (P-type)